MASIRERAERHWNGEGDLVGAEHPVAPAAGSVGEELQDGVYYLKSIAAVTALDTGDGLVMLDTGSIFDQNTVYDQLRAWRPQPALAAAVFSHHHVDHVFGTARFEAEAESKGWAPPVVYGHEAMGEHFDRYRRTLGWNTAINVRQFGFRPDSGFAWPGDYRYPDVTYRDELSFNRGGLTFELHHARGETDDATWTWVPELGLLHPGDLFIYAVPNAGNPQKVQRYLSDWATALRQMAALGAETMVSGHGLPIFGADRIRQALSETAELLESIEYQTLTLMNEGKSLDLILSRVEVPARLADRPFLRPVYDHPQFLVRSVWRRYGGWYEGEPDRLLPAPRADEAREWVALAGGLAPVLARARQLAEDDEGLRLACHLVEAAVLAAPGDREAHRLRAEIYERRAAAQESSMARNIMRHAAISSLEGRRDLAGSY